MTTTELISQEINRLDEVQQVRLLEFARTLAKRPAGVKLQDLQHMVGAFSPDDLNEIEKIIDEDCERVDAQSW